MKSKNWLAAFVFGLSLLASACGESSPPPTPAPTAMPSGDPVAGQQLYATTCIACHGANAKGVKGLGKDLTASEFVKANSDAELVKFLAKGRPSSDPANTTKVDMPPRGGNPALKDADLLNIAAYVRSLQP